MTPTLRCAVRVIFGSYSVLPAEVGGFGLGGGQRRKEHPDEPFYALDPTFYQRAVGNSSNTHPTNGYYGMRCVASTQPVSVTLRLPTALVRPGRGTTHMVSAGGSAWAVACFVVLPGANSQFGQTRNFAPTRR